MLLWFLLSVRRTQQRQSVRPAGWQLRRTAVFPEAEHWLHPQQCKPETKGLKIIVTRSPSPAVCHYYCALQVVFSLMKITYFPFSPVEFHLLCLLWLSLNCSSDFTIALHFIIYKYLRWDFFLSLLPQISFQNLTVNWADIWHFCPQFSEGHWIYP